MIASVESPLAGEGARAGGASATSPAVPDPEVRAVAKRRVVDLGDQIIDSSHFLVCHIFRIFRLIWVSYYPLMSRGSPSKYLVREVCNGLYLT